jgi:hypothetical protein
MATDSVIANISEIEVSLRINLRIVTGRSAEISPVVIPRNTKEPAWLPAFPPVPIS